MFGKFVFSLMAMLLVCSGVLASVGQTQGFSIGAFNDITRSGCVGSAEGRNMATVGHAQKLYDASHATTIRQEESARLTQNAKANGSGGKDVVSQRGSIEGIQGQYVRAGHSGTRTQEQTLGANLETFVSHKGAVGRVVGEQCAVGSQSQKETTPNGFSESQQSFRTSQFTAVWGGSASNIKVNNGVEVSLSQNQFVSGGN
jgi:hypothetical protein